MENKKIRNTTAKTVNNITFKSRLEASMYKTLLNLGIPADYEKYTYTISNDDISHIPFYNRTPKKGFHLMSAKVSSLTYTPDFTFHINGVLVIIEAKGIENDVFPVKRNLFRKFISQHSVVPTLYFEVRNTKELKEAIEIAKKENIHKQQFRLELKIFPSNVVDRCFKLLEEEKYDKIIKVLTTWVKKNRPWSSISHIINQINRIKDESKP